MVMTNIKHKAIQNIIQYKLSEQIMIMHFKASEAKASFHEFQKEIW